MNLTRRDALAALAAAGAGGSVAGCLDAPPSSDPDVEEALPVLVATAEVVYPSAVEDPGEFVETYAVGRVRENVDYHEGVIRATEDLDRLARVWYGDEFATLDPDTRERVLREAGVETADPDPAGSTAERLRYYVVNELLYALFASPTGGRLVGTENPVGFPGGTTSYQRGPQS